MPWPFAGTGFSVPSSCGECFARAMAMLCRENTIGYSSSWCPDLAEGHPSRRKYSTAASSGKARAIPLRSPSSLGPQQPTVLVVWYFTLVQHQSSGIGGCCRLCAQGRTERYCRRFSAAWGGRVACGGGCWGAPMLVMPIPICLWPTCVCTSN